MDRDALVRRNQALTQAFHTRPLRHQIRSALIRLIAHIPLRQQQESQPRILLIRPDHLGDVLLSTPAIRALKAARPATELHALVGPWSANVLANIPEVDAVLTLNFPGFERDGHKRGPFAPYIQLLRSARHLRQIGYTSAVILRPDHWWGAVLAYLAGIPQRIGYHLPEVAPFLTHGLELRREHVVMQNCRLVEQWTGPMQPEDARYEFPVYDADSDYINDYLQNWGITPSQDLICIHPGSGTWVKLWQAEKWASVADTLSEQLDAQVVFTGGEQERALVQQIAAGMRHNPCIMVGDTRLEQLAALYSRAKVVLGPDSGPMHLAAAVGTPTVTLYGPADPVEFGTWGPKAKHFIITTDIGCRPCRVLDWADDNPEFHPCVREITIGQVLSAARQAANYRS